MAVQCGNLGLVYQKNRQYNEAQIMYEKALEIHRSLGDLEGAADNYYNLGIMYRQQQDYGRAEETHQRALEIFEQTGNLKGMADVYVNLAGIRIQEKKHAGAREYISQSRSLYSRLNMQDMVEKMDQWLDSLPEADA
jgi:tetratricopeptide (TPR) repeat protein